MIRRRTRLFLYSLAVWVASVAPIVVFLELSYLQTVDHVESELEFLSRSTAKRSSHILTVTHDTLKEVARRTGGRCDENTVNVMKDFVFRIIYIREIGLIIDGELRCTDQGILDPPHRILDKNTTVVSEPGEIAIIPPSKTLRPGKSIIVNYRISDNAYANALIDPEIFCEFHEFLNIGEESGIFLVDEEGTTLVSLGKMDARELPAVRNKESRVEQHRGKYFAVTHAGDQPIYAVVAASKSYMHRHWQRNVLIFSLMGAAVSAICIFLVVRLAARGDLLMVELNEALLAGQLEVHYQPIVDLASGKSKGVEALLRWRHPQRGLIPPSVFIPLAEQNGLIRPITAWLMKRVVVEMGELLNRSPHFTVGINVSALHFQNEWLANAVTENFDGKIPLNQVVYEITETSFVKDDPVTNRVMWILRAGGGRLAIDDFGTGYSNLRNLQLFPVDILKVDKAFIDGIESATQSSGLVDAIVQIAQSLQLQIVAEGVERADQVDYLRRVGVCFIQGWYFARPMPIQDLLRFVATTARMRGE